MPGCGRPEHSKGVCNGHYNRLRKWGELRPELPLQERVHAKGQVCATEGCDRPATAKGRCNAHYNRHRTSGDDRADQPLKPVRYDWDAQCIVAGCERAARKLGRCEMHYQRFRATGTDKRPKRCSVCRAKCEPRWDHSHQSGEFRGWLCNRCNLVLGNVNDDPNVLRALADYLEKR